MAVLDEFALASMGVFPAPTPTGSQRAAFAVIYGLLGSAPAPAALKKSWVARILGGITRLKKGLSL